MIRFDYLLFGYKEIHINKQDIAKAATYLYKNRLSGKISSSGILIIPLSQTKKYKSVFRDIEFKESEPKGIFGLFLKNRSRYALFCALAITLFLIFYLSDFVWDIRIEGNENKTDFELQESISSAGLDIGSRWSKVSLSEIESFVLDNCDDVAWININRRGTVAYVTLKETDRFQDNISVSAYSNIVASVDCIIEDITVRKGIPMVKSGDIVKAGDLLISGVISGENGVSFCDADGEVIGRTAEKISVNVLRNESKISYGKEILKDISVKFLNNNIIIYKSYGNSTEEYVIIKEKTRLNLFGVVTYPITICKTYIQQKSSIKSDYTDEQLISIASQRLNNKREVMFSHAEILKLRTYGDFTADGYSLVSEMEIMKDVGIKKSFGN